MIKTFSKCFFKLKEVRAIFKRLTLPTVIIFFISYALLPPSHLLAKPEDEGGFADDHGWGSDDDFVPPAIEGHIEPVRDINGNTEAQTIPTIDAPDNLIEPVTSPVGEDAVGPQPLPSLSEPENLVQLPPPPGSDAPFNYGEDTAPLETGHGPDGLPPNNLPPSSSIEVRVAEERDSPINNHGRGEQERDHGENREQSKIKPNKKHGDDDSRTMGDSRTDFSRTLPTNLFTTAPLSLALDDLILRSSPEPAPLVSVVAPLKQPAVKPRHNEPIPLLNPSGALPQSGETPPGRLLPEEIAGPVLLQDLPARDHGFYRAFPDGVPHPPGIPADKRRNDFVAYITSGPEREKVRQLLADLEPLIRNSPWPIDPDKIKDLRQLAELIRHRTATLSQHKRSNPSGVPEGEAS
jgi:hypothetical protein